MCQTIMGTNLLRSLWVLAKMTLSFTATEIYRLSFQHFSDAFFLPPVAHWRPNTRWGLKQNNGNQFVILHNCHLHNKWLLVFDQTGNSAAKVTFFFYTAHQKRWGGGAITKPGLCCCFSPGRKDALHGLFEQCHFKPDFYQNWLLIHSSVCLLRRLAIIFRVRLSSAAPPPKKNPTHIIIQLMKNLLWSKW